MDFEAERERHRRAFMGGLGEDIAAATVFGLAIAASLALAVLALLYLWS